MSTLLVEIFIILIEMSIMLVEMSIILAELSFKLIKLSIILVALSCYGGTQILSIHRNQRVGPGYQQVCSCQCTAGRHQEIDWIDNVKLPL